MRDVVVIGGGLSGLAACHELQRLGARYTVMEVKRRFGGGIHTHLAGGFVMDGCGFVFRALDGSRLESLGMAGRQLAIGEGRAVMRGGAESLVNALANPLRGGRLMRMALSSLGWLDGRYTLCLENGLMLDAGSVILALPARYAARVLWNLAPDAAGMLAEFRYERLARVSLGVCKGDLGALPEADDVAFALMTDAPSRVPDDNCALMQLGLRCDDEATDAMLIDRAAELLDIKLIAAHVHRWAEADSLREDNHNEIVRAIRGELPPGVQLIGSDYCTDAPCVDGVARLDERMDMGINAARSKPPFVDSS